MAEPPIPGGTAIVAHREFERCAGIMVPDLVGIDPVPVRALTRLEQEEDRGAGAAPPSSVGVRRPKCLTKMPAFGMRPQSEAGNDLVS